MRCHHLGLFGTGIWSSWISWKILAKAKAYSNVSKRCNLCVEEKYFVISNPQMATLNKRNSYLRTVYLPCRPDAWLTQQHDDTTGFRGKLFGSNWLAGDRSWGFCYSSYPREEPWKFDQDSKEICSMESRTVPRTSGIWETLLNATDKWKQGL